MSTQEINSFWEAYQAGEPPESAPETYTAWGFGNTPKMADELGALVLAGTKTGTASLYWFYLDEDEPLPKWGDLSVITNGQGQPICIIKTVAVHILPFNEVGEEFAYLEGEGDRSLEYWRRVHWKFFEAECAAIDRQPTDTMLVVCEYFQKVYP